LSRCPEAAFVEARADRYQAVTLAMVEVLLAISPTVEPAEPGVVYVEIAGQAGGPVPAAMEAEVARTIGATAERASGLKVRIGLADGKFQAYVAALAAPAAGSEASGLD